jgi:hypothetical protein
MIYGSFVENQSQIYVFWSLKQSFGDNAVFSTALISMCWSCLYPAASHSSSVRAATVQSTHMIPSKYLISHFGFHHFATMYFQKW